MYALPFTGWRHRSTNNSHRILKVYWYKADKSRSTGFELKSAILSVIFSLRYIMYSRIEYMLKSHDWIFKRHRTALIAFMRETINSARQCDMHSPLFKLTNPPSHCITALGSLDTETFLKLLTHNERRLMCWSTHQSQVIWREAIING